MSFTSNFFAYFKFHSDWGRVTGKIKQNELDCRDTAPLNQLVQILDTAADWLLTTAWGTLNLTDATIGWQEWHNLSVLARSMLWWRLWKVLKEHDKQCTTRVWRWRQVKSYEQTSGVFNFIQRNEAFISSNTTNFFTNFLFQTITTCSEIVFIDVLGI